MRPLLLLPRAVKALCRLPLLLLLSSPLAAQGQNRPCGTIERIEVTSLTRDRIILVAHANLARLAQGTKQSFAGEIAMSSVPLPVVQPVWVATRVAGGRNEAFVYLTIDLGKIPEALLARAGTHSLDLTMKGTLTGERGTTAPVCAVGLLRFGTPEVYAPSSFAQKFFSFSGAHLTGISLSETSGEATVILFNPFSFPVPLKRLGYALDAAESRLGEGVIAPTRIRPRQENRIVVPITVKNRDLIAVAGSTVMSGGTLEGRLVASMTFKVGRDEITLPISLTGRIEVGR